MYGKTAFWMAERYPQFGVWTFDFSERFVEHCRVHNPIGDRLHIWQGDCTRICDGKERFDSFFDFGTCIDVTEHLPADVYRGLLRELARVIKPGGHLLLIARHREASDPEGEMPWPSRVRKFPPSPFTVSRKSCSTFFLMSASRTSAVFASFSAGRDLRAPPQCSAASTLRNAITAATNSSDFSIGGTCPHLSKVISFAPAIPAA